MDRHRPATLALNELMGLSANHPFAYELLEAFPDWLDNTPSFLDIKRWGDTKDFRHHGRKWNLTFMRIHRVKDILDFARVTVKYEVKDEHTGSAISSRKTETAAFTGD